MLAVVAHFRGGPRGSGRLRSRLSPLSLGLKGTVPPVAWSETLSAKGGDTVALAALCFRPDLEKGLPWPDCTLSPKERPLSPIICILMLYYTKGCDRFSPSNRRVIQSIAIPGA